MTNSGRPRNFDEKATLKRVMKCFWKHGYDKTTFDQLVADSGLSRSSLYNAFGGKEQLFEKAFQLYKEEEFDSLVERLQNEESGPEELKKFIQILSQPLNRRRKCLLRNTVLHNASTMDSPTQVEDVESGLCALWEGMTSAASNSDSADSKPITDKETASLLVAALFGSAVISRNGRNKKLLDAISSGAAKLVQKQA